MKKQLPPLIKSRLVIWYLTTYLYQALHYILGVLGTVSSILVASKPSFISTTTIDTLAVVSSICIVLLAFLLPSRRSNAMANAFRRLAIAADRYLLIDEYTISDLLKVVEECDITISATDPS